MIISGVVYEALQGFVSGRCGPTFPEPTNLPIWPAIRCVLIDGVAVQSVCGTGGVDTDDTRVQLDLAAKSHGAVLALRDQVITAMQSTYPPCARAGYGEEYDPETKTHRVRLDYIFNPSSQ